MPIFRSKSIHAAIPPSIKSRVCFCNLVLQFGCVLDHGDPLVGALNLYSRLARWRVAVQTFMRSKVVVVQLDAFQNWRIGFFQTAHNLFSIAKFTVHPLHLIVVVLVLCHDTYLMDGTRVCYCEKFPLVRFFI